MEKYRNPRTTEGESILKPNLIKITSLTAYSPLQICCSTGDLKKSHYWSQDSDPTFVCHEYLNYDMINTGYDLFRPITLLIANKAVTLCHEYLMI